MEGIINHVARLDHVEDRHPSPFSMPIRTHIPWHGVHYPMYLYTWQRPIPRFHSLNFVGYTIPVLPTPDAADIPRARFASSPEISNECEKVEEESEGNRPFHCGAS